MRRVLLLRHTDIAAHWAGRCYGRSDVGLSATGRHRAHALSETIDGADYDRIIAAPARRARWLGGLLARRRGVALEVQPLLAERDFGAWEGIAWQAIWEAEGNSMDGMLDAPGTFRPGGGETTHALAQRVLGWWHALPTRCAVLVVAHGGPIGALVGSLLGEAPRQWLAQVPRPGEGVLIATDASYSGSIRVTRPGSGQGVAKTSHGEGGSMPAARRSDQDSTCGAKAVSAALPVPGEIPDERGSGRVTIGISTGGGVSTGGMITGGVTPGGGAPQFVAPIGQALKR